MNKCEYCLNEICVNADCPICADFCPWEDSDGCRFAKRSDTE